MADVLRSSYEKRGMRNDIAPSTICPIPQPAPSPYQNRYERNDFMKKAYNVEVVENEDKWEFEKEISDMIKGRSVIDIKFAVTPEICTGSFGDSYSVGEKYYAMIIFE